MKQNLLDIYVYNSFKNAKLMPRIPLFPQAHLAIGRTCELLTNPPGNFIKT
jgi:hypothetical protein